MTTTSLTINFRNFRELREYEGRDLRGPSRRILMITMTPEQVEQVEQVADEEGWNAIVVCEGTAPLLSRGSYYLKGRGEKLPQLVKEVDNSGPAKGARRGYHIKRVFLRQEPASSTLIP